MTRIEKIKTATIIILALSNLGQAIATLHRSQDSNEWLALIDRANENANKWKKISNDAIAVAKANESIADDLRNHLREVLSRKVEADGPSTREIKYSFPIIAHPLSFEGAIDPTPGYIWLGSTNGDNYTTGQLKLNDGRTVEWRDYTKRKELEK